MSENPLGQPTRYISEYAPELLFPITRSEKRDELEQGYLDFQGEDIWNAYELSWLNPKGLPQVAIGEFRFDSGSSHIVESKSLKLYLNSFNQSKFKSIEEVTNVISNDLSKASGAKTEVSLYCPSEFAEFKTAELEGELIDNQDIQIEGYGYQPLVLKDAINLSNPVQETLISHILKSNCLITSQPDWASIQIKYSGPKIDRARLLAYLVSFRSHNEFHEQCVERIFCDLKRFCKSDKLTVYARYTRRGGLDINPWRSDFESAMRNIRLARQ